MVKVGILGAAGYTGGELIRLLINHPEAEIVFANSESNAGNLVAEVHEGLYGETDLKFTAEMPFDQVDVIFFCFGHGKSEAFLKEHNVPENVKIIDLAQDFRLAPETVVATQQPTPAAHDFVYGLPEINESKIAVAQHVANPGCLRPAFNLVCCLLLRWASSTAMFLLTPLPAAPVLVRSQVPLPISHGATTT